MWKHLSYREFEDFFGDLGLTTWVKFNWLAEVPDGFDKVDLGQIDWEYFATWGVSQCFATTLTEADPPPTSADVGEILCLDKEYQVEAVSTMYSSPDDMTIGLSYEKRLVIKNFSWSSSAEAKAGLSGVWLIYKKE